MARVGTLDIHAQVGRVIFWNKRVFLKKVWTHLSCMIHTFALVSAIYRKTSLYVRNEGKHEDQLLGLLGTLSGQSDS